MSASQTSSPCMQKLDPLKRVNYTFGMVLGVDEFRQEQTYLIEKDHSQYRLAHGYGTACGLRVRIETTPDLEVKISPGAAINPQGQEIHVCQEMCARLNDWLANNQSVLNSIFGPPPFSMSLCVVLCYRECPTDLVPVPGEPCRSQQDAMAPSHIAESFQLKLCLDEDQLGLSPPASPPLDSSVSGLCFRPAQPEENAIRQFGKLLARIQITDVAPSSVSKGQLEDLVRMLAPGSNQTITTSPPVSSPPEGSSPIYLFVDDAREFLRDAFRVWITEVRPALTKTAGCGCGTPAEQCVLLAELHFNVAKGWQVSGAVNIDESQRPYLLETRLLQECLLNGISGSAIGGGVSGRVAVVAAGTFTIIGNNAAAAGPVLNGLTALPGAQPGTFVLDWIGTPAYVNPHNSSPANHTYVVKGTALAGKPASSPYVLQVLDFRNDGILIGVQGAKGNDAAAGFQVEISEITGSAHQ